MDAFANSSWAQLGVDTTTSAFSVDEADRRVRALHLPNIRPPQLHLHLRAEKRSGELVIRTRDLEIGWPEKSLFFTPDIELRRTDCAALIGPNGAGKSTFLKTILAQLQPRQGEVLLGASLHIGYFAQAHEGLNPANSLIQEIQSAAPNMLATDARQYLGKFLFSGDDAYKKVEVLSGGERGRLALAKLALEDTNLLLLDEPTNHLDIPSQEILEQVLEAYEGTILLVSHDRYLVDALATQVWEIKPDESTLSIFKGTYSQMRDERDRLEALGTQDETNLRQVEAPRKPVTGRDPGIKEERRRLARLQELENLIANLELRLAEISRNLENRLVSPSEVVKLGNEYQIVQKEMDLKLTEWESLQK